MPLPVKEKADVNAVHPRVRYFDEQMLTMYAERGDRLVVRSHVNLPARDAEILEVSNPDGSPPYRVRWSDSGREAFVFPGPDAHVEHVTHETADRTGSTS